VPKNVVHTLQADYAGQTVFMAKFGPGISANPFLQFWLLPTESGRLRVHWHDDLGQTGEISARVELAPA